MAEYIDKEKLLENLRTELCNDCSYYHELNCGFCDIDCVIGDIEDTPTADVQEIKRAQWIYEDVDWVCSNCGGDAFNKPGYSFQTPTAYCPHCGASMWGGGE